MDGNSIDRRSFLRRSAAGTAILAVAPLLATGCSAYPAVADLHFFTNKEWHIALKIAEAILPPGVQPETVVAELDRMSATQGAAAQSDLRAALLAVEHGSAILEFTFCRFSKLPLERRRELLNDWAASSMQIKQMLVAGFRQPMLFLYYGNESVWREIGYDGPLVDEDEVWRP